jgi:hypothetical protein
MPVRRVGSSTTAAMVRDVLPASTAGDHPSGGVHPLRAVSPHCNSAVALVRGHPAVAATLHGETLVVIVCVFG